MNNKIDTSIIMDVIPDWVYCRRKGIVDYQAQKKANEVFAEMEKAVELITPHNPAEELPENPGEYLVKFNESVRFYVLRWDGERWYERTNKWMQINGTIKAWWHLPEVHDEA